MHDGLTEKERNLLAYCLEKYKPNLLIKLPILDSGVPERDLVNEMINIVGSELMAKGFLKGDKKSFEYGEELERLIDKLVDSYLDRPKK